MLIEFTVENYRSFAESATLSMVATKLTSRNKHLDENTLITLPGQPELLTSAVVYGANASGKSSFIAALGFMRRFVLSSYQGTEPMGAIDVESFRLNPETVGKPSLFEIVFVDEGQRFRYGFEVDKEAVQSEWLFHVPNKVETPLFEREGQTVTAHGEFKKEASQLIERTRQNALLLSVAAQFNGKYSQRVTGWFRRMKVSKGVTDRSWRNFTERSLQSDKFRMQIVEFIKSLDLGIQDIKIEKGVKILGHKTGQLPFEALTDDTDRNVTGRAYETTEIRTLHSVYDSEGQIVGTSAFDLYGDESDGTKKLFEIAGPLLDILRSGHLLVADELDARLHPQLTRAIVSLFNSHTANPRQAQLLFATHDTNLLDKDLFRRDQIWFVEKNSKGASNLYSLAEFRGVRNDKNYESGYIEGRYGAIPYLRLSDISALFSSSEDDDAQAPG